MFGMNGRRVKRQENAGGRQHEEGTTWCLTGDRRWEKFSRRRNQNTVLQGHGLANLRSQRGQEMVAARVLPDTQSETEPRFPVSD